MGEVGGFLKIHRQTPADRPVEERVRDFKDVHTKMPEGQIKKQAARCMDCGVPYCHRGCPLGNIIPDFNDLVCHTRWKEALVSILSTNNFPEFTGRICPAPCEDACTLSINDDPVTIERIEQEIVEHAWREGWMTPRMPRLRTGRRVAVVGSGPAGLACADQLNRAGHAVTVWERADRPGGLLMYGIPDFKLEKWIVERRIDLMKAEGIEFRTGVDAGVDVSADDIRRQFDAVVLAMGACQPRDLAIPGRELAGVHFAMEYLTMQNRKCHGEKFDDGRFISAEGKNVIVIGGGDTGSDCHGTAIRQGARSVHMFEILSKPPEHRMPGNPWPDWARIIRTTTSHEEGGQRDWGIRTKKFSGENGRVKKYHGVKVEWTPVAGGPPKMTEVAGSEFEMDADLVLLAVGFLGPEKHALIRDLGVGLTDLGAVSANADYETSVPGVFSCGDMRRGQSLVVWAIWEGREAARGVDKYLMRKTNLPSSPQLIS